MEQDSLLDLFGITEKDLERKSAKSDTKKGKTGTSSAKSGRSKAGNFYELPVTVYGCGYSCTVPKVEDKQISHNRLTEYLRKEFAALEAFSFKLKKTEEKDLVITQDLKAEEEELTIGETKICYGDTELHFSGGTIEDAKEMWCQEHPEFTECSMAYSKEKKVLLPFFESNTAAGKTYDTPLQIGIMQHILQIEGEEKGVTLEKLQEQYFKKYPFYKGCSFFFSEEENLLIPVFEESRNEKKSDVISLPVKVRTALTELEYGPEDFGGKTSVKLEDIRMKLEQIYPEFSKERTHMEYDKRHFIIPILKGSTKGVVIRSRNQNYGLYIVEGCDGKTHRIEKTPVGEFAVCISDPEEEPEFHFALPKIPGEILEEVMQFFLDNREHEVACQLFYTKEEGYTIYYPRQDYSLAAVTFERDPILESQKTLVMDMHSHGGMPAFFSAQDNRDEKGTRLYMVAGNLYRTPQIRVRAGIIGHFLDLYCGDLFEGQYEAGKPEER